MIRPTTGLFTTLLPVSYATLDDRLTISTWRGVRVCKGFLYLDMDDPAHSNTVVMLQKLRENMASLTAREVKKSALARKDQAWVGTPTDNNLIDMVSKATLVNCLVTPVYIANTRHMFGPDLPGVKRNTVRRKPDRVELYDITITSDYHLFVSVALNANIIFVNGMPFLITLSWCIRLITVEHIPPHMAND